jgi:hypothetical protein
MLIVVSANAQASVPNVTGMKVDAAKEALTAAKLTPQVQQVDSNQPAGLVLSQDPVAGTKGRGRNAGAPRRLEGAGDGHGPVVARDCRSRTRRRSSPTWA